MATSLETLQEILFILSQLTSTSIAIRVTQDYLRMTKIKKYEMSLAILEHALEIMEITPPPTIQRRNKRGNYA